MTTGRQHDRSCFATLARSLPGTADPSTEGRAFPGTLRESVDAGSTPALSTKEPQS